ncbi:unnamed protein product [Cylicostephanus goldi]|uniref:Secreted protein n=1 Tax=Cylicostephanus goldi TaxID=71465 RepID=A0A3P7MQ05_CYLGO|nr:unnamed protein product [Cylicostephanus goldi]
MYRSLHMPSLLFPLLAITLRSVLHSSSGPLEFIAVRTETPPVNIEVGIGVTLGVVKGEATTELHAESAC